MPSPIPQADLFGETFERSAAIFSSCRRYRFTLTRRWAEGPYVNFIGLNPSTADELEDDPTIRRCIGFAKRLGAGAFTMTNLFAYRATDPDRMKAVADPVGQYNDTFLVDAARCAHLVIAAWGVHGTHHARDIEVCELLHGVHPLGLQCLGRSKDGHPRHPLYLPSDSPLSPFTI